MIRDATVDTSYVGIQFLPVEKKLYLKIQSILRRLELRFSSLKETLFLYRDQLIWYRTDRLMRSVSLTRRRRLLLLLLGVASRKRIPV